MDSYKLEPLEIAGDMLEDGLEALREWLAFEEDMKTNPWG